MSARRRTGAAVATGVATALATVVVAAVCGLLPVSSGAAEPGSAHRHRAEGCAARVLDGMDLRQRVGQLFVIGVQATGPTRRESRLVASRHVGGVVLMGHSDLGVRPTRAVTRQLQHASTGGGARLWVAADQEGGQVQRLRGPGFAAIPEALAQGRLDPAVLRDRARRWGRQLARAGVNIDLAPVLDTVPAALGEENEPIGGFHREFGHRPVVVARHGTAFLDGMRRAGVVPAVKHFPGLGRVQHNTDTRRHVTDRVTTPHDPYLRPFRAAVRDHAPVVMISSATYRRIDRRRPGPFSHTIVTGMLRHDLGFTGVVMSDDLAAARAVAGVPVARRAIRFLRAGGTVVLGVDAATTAPMIDAVLHRARGHRHFRQRVDAEAGRVLRAKHAAGLLRCG